MKKINGGFEIKNIFDLLKNKSQDQLTQPKHMVLYFTQAHTFVNILNTINVYEVNQTKKKTVRISFTMIILPHNFDFIFLVF